MSAMHAVNIDNTPDPVDIPLPDYTDETSGSPLTAAIEFWGDLTLTESADISPTSRHSAELCQDDGESYDEDALNFDYGGITELLDDVCQDDVGDVGKTRREMEEFDFLHARMLSSDNDEESMIDELYRLDSEIDQGLVMSEEEEEEEKEENFRRYTFSGSPSPPLGQSPGRRRSHSLVMGGGRGRSGRPYGRSEAFLLQRYGRGFETVALYVPGNHVLNPATPEDIFPVQDLP